MLTNRNNGGLECICIIIPTLFGFAVLRFIVDVPPELLKQFATLFLHHHQHQKFKSKKLTVGRVSSYIDA